MFQYPHGNFPSSEGLFSRGKLRLALFLLQCNGSLARYGSLANNGSMEGYNGSLAGYNGSLAGSNGSLAGKIMIPWQDLMVPWQDLFVPRQDSNLSLAGLHEIHVGL
jgi:hypothetical protein